MNSGHTVHTLYSGRLGSWVQLHFSLCFHVFLTWSSCVAIVMTNINNQQPDILNELKH